MRRWGDHGKRLSGRDTLKFNVVFARDQTFAAAAEAVGCSSKSVQRLMKRTGA